MTKLEDFPIHHCIFKNDPKTLEELLKDIEVQKKINQKDNHGNTPVHLALMLNRHNCLMVLLQYDCDVFSRNHYGWSPINEITMLNDIDALEKIYLKMWKGYHKKVEDFSKEWNKTTPYLYLKFEFRVKTSIPILKKLNHKSYFEIYKNKDSFKFTTTIGGMDSRGIPKLLKGNMSMIIKYDESSDSYKAYGLNNVKKLFQELYPHIPDYYLINSYKSKLGANKIINFHPDFSRFILKPKKGNILKNNYKTFTLENGTSYRAVAYKGKHFEFLMHTRKDEAIINENESIIQNAKKEHDSLKPKMKRKNSKLMTESQKISEDNSDSESNSDSDSEYDSDNEKKIKNKKLSKEDEKVIGYFDKTFDQKNKNKNKDNDDEVIMYTVNKDGETKTFKYETSMESTLDWEQAYHEKYSKSMDLMYDVLGYGGKNNEKVKHLSPQEIEKLNLKKVTEEEYFNPTTTNPLHLGRIMEVNEEKKPYHHKIKLWMAKESSKFPVSINDIKPIIKFISALFINPSVFNKSDDDTHKETSTIKLLDQKSYEFLTSTLFELFKEKNTFPLKVNIPIYSSIYLQFATIDCSTDPKFIPDKQFEIPSDYKNGDVYFERIEK